MAVWAVAVLWRGVAVWRRRLQCIGGCGILEGACSVLEGCGILEKPLAVVWRSVAFLEGTCSVLCFGLEGVSSVLEGHGIFGGRLQCFGGVWHIWRV